MNVRDALRMVVIKCPDQYAKAYALRGLPMVGEDLKTQILYVLSNTGGWRGPEAKEVKAVLKEASK